MLDTSAGVLCYTDGSSGGEGSPGGWGWVAVGAGTERETGSGFDPPPTTNNRMELSAAIFGLRSLRQKYGPLQIEVVSDSQYVVLGATYPERARNVNTDLWSMLDEEIEKHEHVQFRHVKGHKGNVLNEEADRLAVTARRKAQW